MKNGELAPQTNTPEQASPANQAPQQEWTPITGTLTQERPAVEIPTADKREAEASAPSPEDVLGTSSTEALPVTSTTMAGELFPPDEEFRGREGEIAARLEPTELGKEKKQELLVKSLSDSAKDVAEYGEARAKMTPEQRKEFDDHREYAALHEMQSTNPDAFNREIANLPQERRTEYFDFAKAEAKAQQDRIVEQASRQETKTDYLLLHSLKFSDPARFEEVFGHLTPAQKGAFDAFEAKEDANMKTSNPNMMIPKLSTSGEKWMVSGELPADAVASLPPKQPYRTAEQMREDAADANKKDEGFVNSIKTEEKPKGWARVRGWFSRKPKK